jgi:hypothetical protein
MLAIKKLQGISSQKFCNRVLQAERKQAPTERSMESNCVEKAYSRPISHNCYWVFLFDKADKHMISMVASKYADDHQADQVDQVNPTNDINDVDLESPIDKEGEERSGGAEDGGSGDEEIVLNPDRFDVLLGRGRTYRYHPGNLRFQSEFGSL